MKIKELLRLFCLIYYNGETSRQLALSGNCNDIIVQDMRLPADEALNKWYGELKLSR